MLWVLIRIALQTCAIFMSTHNIGFYEDLTKIIFELSSNTHLISSAEGCHGVVENKGGSLKFSTLFITTTRPCNILRFFTFVRRF